MANSVDSKKLFSYVFIFVLALLFGLFSALCAGLLRMVLRPGLPTRASAQRTLDLPVLGTATVKRA